MLAQNKEAARPQTGRLFAQTYAPRVSLRPPKSNPRLSQPLLS
jgi:hypothetical protein